MTRRRRKAAAKGKKPLAQASKEEVEDVSLEDVDSQTDSIEDNSEKTAEEDPAVKKGDVAETTQDAPGNNDVTMEGENLSQDSAGDEKTKATAEVADETSRDHTEGPPVNSGIEKLTTGSSSEDKGEVPAETVSEETAEPMDCDAAEKASDTAQTESTIDGDKSPISGETKDHSSNDECIAANAEKGEPEKQTDTKITNTAEQQKGETTESSKEAVIAQIDLTESDEDRQMEVDKKSNTEKKSETKVLYVPAYVDGDNEDTVFEEDPEFDTEEEQTSLKESKDFVKYWGTVNDNPQDFTAWTYLLQLVEQEGQLGLGRRSYNSFFKRYPLCYGYWKKFSEFERKNGNLERAQKILERGVRAIPLSIDLWVHVIDFYINHYNGPDAGKERNRSIFDRAIKAAGEEFRSEKLWNKYIQWELANKDWCQVIKVYKRAISTLTQHYSIFFTDFKEFVNKHSPQDYLSPTDFQDMLAQVRSYLLSQSSKKAEVSADGKKADDDDGEPGGESAAIDEAPPGVDDGEKPPNEEEIKLIRVQVIKDMKKIYEETEQAVTKIWAYEEGIKRPYFHVKQLERAQLKNWREYLDMEMNKENHRRVVLLFERCLIACALYEDFWLKYAKYMTKYDGDKARSIYERACNTHLPKKPNIHMQWAAHEELVGNRQEASRILERLDNVLPGMAMIKMRRVAVERRCGNVQAAEDLLKSYVASAAKDKEEVFYTRKLAWLLFKISGKKDEARKLMKELIPKYKSDVRLYNDLVEMEFQNAGGAELATAENEILAMEAFDIAIHSDKLSEEQQLSFSKRKVEFLEDYGADVKRLQKAYDEQQKLLRNQKKRSQSDASVDGAGPAAKKAKTEVTPITVVGSATTATANGTRYTSGSTTTAASYLTSASVQQQPATAYAAATDPSLYYQQNYWNYQKPADATTAAAQYNYSQQWSQYYASQQQHQ